MGRIEREKEHYDIHFRRAVSPDQLSYVKRLLSDGSFPDYALIRQHYSMIKAIWPFTQDLEGKRVLVYGCGTDALPAWLAQKGAIVDAFDISESSIAYQNSISDTLGIGYKAFVADAHDVGLRSVRYDWIFGKAILHHLQLETALKEIIRLLRPGGHALFRDVLEGNLFLRKFRRFTPQLRTPDECPLQRKDLYLIFRSFELLEYKTASLTAQIPVLLFKLNDHLFKTKLRFVRDFSFRAIPFFDRVDEFLFKVVPSLKNQAWLCLIVLRKAQPGNS